MFVSGLLDPEAAIEIIDQVTMAPQFNWVAIVDIYAAANAATISPRNLGGNTRPSSPDVSGFPGPARLGNRIRDEARAPQIQGHGRTA